MSLSFRRGKAESELPLPLETDNPKASRAKRVAEVTAEAHKKVEKRKKRGDAPGEVDVV